MRACTWARRRVRARPTRPAVHYRRPAVSSSGVCVGTRKCVSECLATSTRPRPRLPAGSTRALATPPAGQSLVDFAAGRRPPAACRYSHNGRRCRATRTPNARSTVHRRRHATTTDLYLLTWEHNNFTLSNLMAYTVNMPKFFGCILNWCTYLQGRNFKEVGITIEGC